MAIVLLVIETLFGLAHPSPARASAHGNESAFAGSAPVSAASLPGNDAGSAAPPARVFAADYGKVELAGPPDGRLDRFHRDGSSAEKMLALFEDGVTRSGNGLLSSSDDGATWSIANVNRTVNRYYEVDPANSSVLYSDDSKSPNGGQNWLDFSGLNSSNQSLTLRPGVPSTLWGRGVSNVARSTDAGISWVNSAPPVINCPNCGSQPVVDGLVADHALDRAYIWTSASSFRTSCSADFGNSTSGATPSCIAVSILNPDGSVDWKGITPILSASPTLTRYLEAYDVALAPSVPPGTQSTVYAAGFSYSPTGSLTGADVIGGVYKSSNGGTSWTRIVTGLPKTLWSTNSVCGGITCYTSFPRIAAASSVAGVADPNTLFIVARDHLTSTTVGPQFADMDRLFRTNNGGTGWTEVALPSLPTADTYVQVRDLAVRAGSTSASTKIVLSLIQRKRSNDVVVEYLSGTFRSADNGATWTRADLNLSNQAFPSQGGPFVKGPDGIYFSSWDLGVIKSTDGGKSWARWTQALTETVKVSSLAFHPTVANTVFVGTRRAVACGCDGNWLGILRSTDGGATFQPRNFGVGNADANILAIAPTSPPTLLAMKYWPVTTFRNGAPLALLRSIDNGDTWFEVVNAPLVEGLKIDPGDPKVMYGMSNDEVYKTIDAGLTWTKLESGATGGNFAIDPNDPDTLYHGAAPHGGTLGFESTGFAVSTNGGDTWEKVADQGIGEGHWFAGALGTVPTVILGVVPKPIGLSSGPALLDFSVDGGRNWFPISNFAPNSVIAGPIPGTAAQALFPGGAFATPIQSNNGASLSYDTRGGMWSYTLGSIPTPPPTPPAIGFGSAGYAVAEGKSVTIDVKLSTATIFTVTAKYDVQSGTAFPGTDYLVATGVLTFAPGVTSASFAVTAMTDIQIEGDETASLVLSDVNNARIDTGSTAGLKITDTSSGPACGEQPDLPPSVYRIFLPTIQVNALPGSGVASASSAGTVKAAASNCNVVAALAPTEPATFDVSVGNVPGGATSVRFSVTGLNFTPAVTGNAVPKDGVAKATLTVPSGLGRFIRADASGPGGSLGVAGSVVGLTPSVSAPIRFDFPLTSQSVSAAAEACSLITPSATQGSAGTIITLNGASFGGDHRIGVLVNGVYTPAAKDPRGNLAFITPIGKGLPPGSTVPLDISDNTSIQSCPNLQFTILDATPAPGASRQFLRDSISYFNALGNVPTSQYGKSASTPYAVRSTGRMLNDLGNQGFFGDDDPVRDAILKNSGAPEILDRVRQKIVDTHTPPTQPLAGESSFVLKYETVEQVIEAQTAMKAIQDRYFNDPDIAAIKFVLQLATGLVGLVFPPAEVAIGTFWLVFTLEEKIVDYATRGVYEIIGIDSTPVSTTLHVGKETPWSGGAITVRRDAVPALRLTDILDVIPIFYGFGKGGDVAADLFLKQFKFVFDNVLGGLATYMSVINAQGEIFQIEADQQSIPLDQHSNLAIEPAGGATYRSGKPGAIRACRTTPLSFTVTASIPTAGGVQSVLAWKSNATQSSSFTVNDIAATAAQIPEAPQCDGPPVRVPVAGGSNHSLAIAKDGTVWAWGANSSGQLGIGDTTGHSGLVHVPGLTGIVAVSAGNEFSLALAGDGKLYAWGRNVQGQLGQGATGGPRSTPVQVQAPGIQFAGMSAGERHVLAYDIAGKLYAWGHNGYGQTGNFSGRDQYGVVRGVAGLSGVTKVAAGRTHSLALSSSGVSAWGYNGFGQLGIGGTSDARSPVPVNVSNVIDVAAGGLFSIALTGDGGVWSWGDNKYGQLGLSNVNGYDRKSSPSRIASLERVTSIAAGMTHALTVDNLGAVRSWGHNDSGQVSGIVNTPTAEISTPEPLEFQTAIKGARVVAGYYHSLLLTTDGEFWAWGLNGSGQGGPGGLVAPHKVSGPVFP